MIDVTKVEITRSGHLVRIYATDGGSEYPIHGAWRDAANDFWCQESWAIDGRHRIGIDQSLDLIEGPETVEVDVWLNVYEDCELYIYRTKKAADISASNNRFACINVKRAVTKGEGL